MNKNCEICKEEFTTYPYWLKRGWGIFCSKKCKGINMSSYQIEEQSHNWKGNKAKQDALHAWIKKRKGLASTHLCIFKNKTCKGMMDWSNISHKYLRKIFDWQVLCRSHHRRFDFSNRNPGKYLQRLSNWKGRQSQR